VFKGAPDVILFGNFYRSEFLSQTIPIHISQVNLKKEKIDDGDLFKKNKKINRKRIIRLMIYFFGNHEGISPRLMMILKVNL
jgi:hypothetical protein